MADPRATVTNISMNPAPYVHTLELGSGINEVSGVINIYNQLLTAFSQNGVSLLRGLALMISTSSLCHLKGIQSTRVHHDSLDPAASKPPPKLVVIGAL